MLKHAHQHDILFGVYAEVEGGRGDWSQTKQYTEHPDWFTPRWPGFGQPDWQGDDPTRNFINLSIPEAADYVETELNNIVDNLHVDIYRHDQNGFLGGQRTSTQRHGFLENDFWRYYDAWHGLLERLRTNNPNLVMQQASGSGTRLELASISHWDENYTSDRVGYPYVCQMLSGLSVYLPPEILVTPIGMNAPTSDTITLLRTAYTLGNTPMLFNAMLPRTTDEFLPGQKTQFLHYANLYKTFIRPILPECKIYHHAPVNATGGVESSEWFAMEFMAQDRSKGWATIINMKGSNLQFRQPFGAYQFIPRGLDRQKKYRVTFDNTSRTEIYDGARLMKDGLMIIPRLHTRSELLLFESN